MGMLNKSLVDNIQRSLTSKRMSWDALSRSSGINLFHIYRIKRGTSADPKLSTIEKIATALDTSVVSLLSDEKEVA